MKVDILNARLNKLDMGKFMLSITVLTCKSGPFSVIIGT
jgi:hypothetical protein